VTPPLLEERWHTWRRRTRTALLFITIGACVGVQEPDEALRWGRRRPGESVTPGE